MRALYHLFIDTARRRRLRLRARGARRGPDETARRVDERRARPRASRGRASHARPRRRRLGSARARAACAAVAARRRARSRGARRDLRQQQKCAERSPASSAGSGSRTCSPRASATLRSSSWRPSDELRNDRCDSRRAPRRAARSSRSVKRWPTHLGGCARCAEGWAAHDALLGESMGEPPPELFARASPSRAPSAMRRRAPVVGARLRSQPLRLSPRSA